MVDPQGNGGLSLRQRSWLRRAIEYCPTKAAGIDTSNNARCDAPSIVTKDTYFVTILKGPGAPLPSAFEAALFVWESRSMSQMMAQQYHVSKNPTWKHERLLVQRSGPDQSHMTSLLDMTNDKTWSVPIGIHKPWSTLFRDNIMGDAPNPSTRRQLFTAHYP